MQPRGLHHGGREIDGGDLRLCARQRFGEQAAAAAHVEHARAGELTAFLHVARAHGIEPMEWFELAVDVPEAMGGGLEFGYFRGVAVR